MQLKILDIQKERITVDPERILSLLGGSVDEHDDLTKELFDEYLEKCLEIMSPRGGYARFPAIEPGAMHEIVIEGTRFRTGKIIRNILRNAGEYAFFAVTAGPEPEILSKSLIDTGQYLEGYIVDLLATRIVESVANQVHEQIKLEAKSRGLKTTNRYSPGHCSWDVSEQQKLFELLPDGCCGITLSESSLMSPIKSVSGIVGIGANVDYREYTCEICSMKGCVYRTVAH